MSEIILHHYPQSPVAEKVRVVLGIKSLDWHAVEIPRLPPKPDLTPLTGGYRRTPVMQIGADVYCDSQCIIRELERRFPSPSLFPDGNAGLAWGISRWTDGPLFTSAIAIVLGAADALPPDFAADRGRLYFGLDFKLENLQAQVSNQIEQLAGQFEWLQQQLDGGDYMHGSMPGLVDALVYYIVLFINGRWAGGPKFLSQFPTLCQWQQRIAKIGHGWPIEMLAAQALAVAWSGKIEDLAMDHSTQENDFKTGANVNVAPEGDGGDPVVSGELIALNRNQVVIGKESKQTGKIAIHFPRVGYKVWHGTDGN